MSVKGESAIKKLKMVLLCTTFAIVMLMSGVLTKSMTERQDILARDPLTTEQLDQMAAEWEVADQTETSTDSRQDQPHSARSAEMLSHSSHLGDTLPAVASTSTPITMRNDPL